MFLLPVPSPFSPFSPFSHVKSPRPKLDACTSREPFVNCGRLAKAKSNSVADVAELADALDSKSGSLWECGFDPLRRYHLNHGFSCCSCHQFVAALATN